MQNLSKNILFGVAVADALGVPIEFKTAQEINIADVDSNYKTAKNRELGFGTWEKPVGTFSDDSSLTFCTAEYLSQNESDLNLLLDRFSDWMSDGYWTTDGDSFDVGRTTHLAILNFDQKRDWTTSGLNTEQDNGNGSLMRISPLLFPLLFDKKITDPYSYIANFSSLTHGHALSIDSCYIYLQFAKHLYTTKDTTSAYTELVKELGGKYKNTPYFARLFSPNFTALPPSDFNNNGFVVGSLELAIHSLLTTSNYREAILKVMALGSDTDTNGAITGALAGILYGYETIPTAWMAPLKRKDAIERLANQLQAAYNK